MVDHKKLFILSLVLFVSLVFSLVFPITARADDGAPPPPPTHTSAGQQSVSDKGTNSSSADTVSSTKRVPVTAPVEPTKDVVAALTDSGSVLLDQNNNPLPLSSQDAANALSGTDPWFDAGGGVIVGYSPTGVCAAGVTECHTTATPIQAAINDARSNNKTIFVEQGTYNENVTIAKQVVLTGLGLGVTTNSFTLNSGANVTGSSNIFAPVVNVNSGAKVQNGVDLVATGGKVNVGPGTYVEQVVINGKNLTLQASAPGAVIQAPMNVPLCFTTSAVHRPVVCVKNTTNVIIKGLTVDGHGEGNANNRLDGIGFYNAGGTVQGNTIEHVRNDPLDGIQAGVGLYAYNQDGTPRNLNVFDNTIFDYQKNGMALSGDGLTVNVKNNTVTGAGPTSLTAQNGIQISYGAVGTVSGNTVSDNYWTGTYGGSNDPISDPNSDSAAGILLYDPGSTAIQIFNNNVFGDQIGIASVGTANLDIHNNNIQGSPHTGNAYPTGIAIWESDQWSSTAIHTSGTILNNTITLNDYGVLVFNNPGLTPPEVGIHNNSITVNTLYGVWSNTFTDATNNYWGDSTGPLDNSIVPDACGLTLTNPTGTGNGASSCVLYNPWLTRDPAAESGTAGGSPEDGRGGASTQTGASVIPVTGGQPTTLSCGTPSITMQIGDIQVTFTGLCGYDVVLNLVAKENLPGDLGPGNTFDNGLSINVLKDGKEIQTLPANASIQVSYPKPVSGSLLVMSWGVNAWNEQPSSVIGNKVITNLSGPATLVLVTH